MSADEEAQKFLDRSLGANWRNEARECGEFWRKTFQTPSERTIEAMRQTTYRKWLGRRGAP